MNLKITDNQTIELELLLVVLFGPVNFDVEWESMNVAFVISVIELCWPGMWPQLIYLCTCRSGRGRIFLGELAMLWILTSHGR